MSFMDPTSTQNAAPQEHLSESHEIIKILSGSRGGISPQELGHLAGSRVLAQYRIAKAETTLNWATDPALAITSVYNMLTVGGPAVALGAGVALDVAIFGGAATDLIKINPIFGALSVGSLVFAVGLAIAKENKRLLKGFLFTAALSASAIIASEPSITQDFAGVANKIALLTTNRPLDADANDAASDATTARQLVTFWQNKVAQDTNHLATGGRDHLPILGDGFPGNDAEGNQLLNVTIPEDNRQLALATAAEARAESTAGVAVKNNPAQNIGFVLGTVTLFAWLAASQMVVANVIESAPDYLRRQREQSMRRNRIKNLVRGLEDHRTSRAVASGEINKTLMEFNGAIATAGSSGILNQPKAGALFAGDKLGQAETVGVDMVCNTIIPRKAFGESVRELFIHTREWFDKRAAARAEKEVRISEAKAAEAKAKTDLETGRAQAQIDREVRLAEAAAAQARAQADIANAYVRMREAEKAPDPTQSASQPYEGPSSPSSPPPVLRLPHIPPTLTA